MNIGFILQTFKINGNILEERDWLNRIFKEDERLRDERC